MQRIGKTLRTISYRLLVVFAWTCVLAFFLWSVGALYYLTTVPYFVRFILAAAYAIGACVLLRKIPRRSHALALLAASVIVIYTISLTQRPSNERTWVEEQERTVSAVIDNQHVNLQNLRHSLYRSETDFKVRRRNMQFDLDQLQSVWFIVQKFTALEGVAHTFISFGVETPSGPEYFSVSVEVRREQGEVYSPVRGLYRQFELMYVVGDERDLIGSRTVMRPNDRVHMYRVNATPTQVQELFVQIAARIEKLRDQPEFYHTLLNNCTNGIVTHTYELTPEPINWLDPRIVLPGFSARFAYAKGLIGAEGQTFDELQEQCRIDPIARQVGLTDKFSEQLRVRNSHEIDSPDL